jgi:hypothetical protein
VFVVILKASAMLGAVPVIHGRTGQPMKELSTVHLLLPQILPLWSGENIMWDLSQENDLDGVTQVSTSSSKKLRQSSEFRSNDRSVRLLFKRALSSSTGREDNLLLARDLCTKLENKHKIQVRHTTERTDTEDE